MQYYRWFDKFKFFQSKLKEEDGKVFFFSFSHINNMENIMVVSTGINMIVPILKLYY